MAWICGMAFKKGCNRNHTYATIITKCEWPRFRDIEPPRRCMISIRTLREKAVRT